MPRQTKLTPERQERIVRAVRACSHLEQAAQVNGINPATFWRWMARGEVETSGIYRKFCEAVHQAEVEAEQMLVGRWMQLAIGSPAQYDTNGNMIRAEVPGNPRAIRDLLARRHPDRWQAKTTVEVSGEIEHTVPEAPDLVVEARARVLELVPGQVAS